METIELSGEYQALDSLIWEYYNKKDAMDALVCRIVKKITAQTQRKLLSVDNNFVTIQLTCSSMEMFKEVKGKLDGICSAQYSYRDGSDGPVIFTSNTKKYPHLEVSTRSKHINGISATPSEEISKYATRLKKLLYPEHHKPMTYRDTTIIKLLQKAPGCLSIGNRLLSLAKNPNRYAMFIYGVETETCEDLLGLHLDDKIIVDSDNNSIEFEFDSPKILDSFTCSPLDFNHLMRKYDMITGICNNFQF